MMGNNWEDRVMDFTMEIPFRVAKRLPLRVVRFVALPLLIVACMPLLIFVVFPCICISTARDMWREAER